MSFALSIVLNEIFDFTLIKSYHLHSFNGLKTAFHLIFLLFTWLLNNVSIFIICSPFNPKQKRLQKMKPLLIF